MKKRETYFFPHDYGARNDPKLQNLLMECGCEGLGIYWCIIEMMYEQGGILPLSNCKSIAFALHIECNAVQRVINDFGLFEKDEDEKNFWSLSVNDRMKKIHNLSDKRKKAAINSWESRRKNVKQMQSKQDASVKDCNAIKGKEKIYNNISTNVDCELDNKIDYDEVVKMYHMECPSFPKIKKLNESRKEKIRLRLKEMDNDLETLDGIFRAMETSKFLRGENKTGWQATFDWLFSNSTNWVKVFEGNYKDKDVEKSKDEKINEIWKK